MIMRIAALCIIATGVILAGLPGAQADEIDAVLNSRICPRPPVKMALIDLKEHCGPDPAHVSAAYLACIDFVTRQNNRIGYYNAFVATCQEGDEKREENSKREIAPAKSPSIADRLKRAKKSAQDAERDDQTFFRDAAAKRKVDLDRYAADQNAMRAKQKAEQARLAEQERSTSRQRTLAEQAAKNADANRESLWRAYFASTRGSHIPCNFDGCKVFGSAEGFPALRGLCHAYGAHTSDGRHFMFIKCLQ